MMPPGPLADDWLYWDPGAVGSYPHSREGPFPNGSPDDSDGEPEQLDLFEDEATYLPVTSRTMPSSLATSFITSSPRRCSITPASARS